VAAGNQQGDKGEFRLRARQQWRQQVAFHVVHVDDRPAQGESERVAKLAPTSSAPTRPGPAVTAMASICGRPIPASASVCRTSGSRRRM